MRKTRKNVSEDNHTYMFLKWLNSKSGTENPINKIKHSMTEFNSWLDKAEEISRDLKERPPPGQIINF